MKANDNRMEVLVRRAGISDDRVMRAELDRLAWGTDASFYRMVPKMVVHPRDEKEVSSLLRTASELDIPVTFRAAGTSLSGQAVSDSLLMVAGKGWEGFRIGEGARTITLQPGIVGAQVNRLLAPYGRKFGPDPASIASCMVGGIVSNNASGMSCGIHANSDRLMESARMVFMDGTILDTASRRSREDFKLSHRDFIPAVERLRDMVRSDKELSALIQKKYSIKNVTGLNLLPLLEYDDPFDIIAHLLVGSEGTLAFLSEVTMRTVELAPLQASAMIYFRSIVDAAKAVVAMRGNNIVAAELLDHRSLLAAGDSTGEGLTAVLTQTQAADREELERNIAAIKSSLEGFDTVTGVNFSTDPDICSRYWAIRSGIFPAVGGMRKAGTTCLIEDVAFHIEDLPQATADLSALLESHGYDDSCIYGHALEGNFHFIINQAFETPSDVHRYEAMIRDVAQMVVGKYGGSLKAEHGTGRNMAPFVAYEWGERAFGVMRSIKHLFDPKGLLNPGVIFNDDPECFISNLKTLPLLETSHVEINKCIECGFCEVNCVSCGFTMSSRTRIVVQREIARLERSGENPRLLSALRKQYEYAGDKTCAADGLCSRSCPMGISVADLTHEIRERNTGALARKVGEAAGRHLGGISSSLRGLLSIAEAGRKLLGEKNMSNLCRGMHNCLGLPLWTPSFPASAHKISALSSGQNLSGQNLSGQNVSGQVASAEGSPLKVVYLPSCINRTMGVQPAAGERRQLSDEICALLHKAGYELIFPEGLNSLCCGMIWESKGMPDVAFKKVRELEAALDAASEGGRYPVLCDQSPCLHRMRKEISALKLYEPVEFIWTFLRDRLSFIPCDMTVAVHPTCSSRLMGVDKMMVDLASLCAKEVLLPEGVGCCGFAGDKGMMVPELNAHALRNLRHQVEESGAVAGYSNSRTCEIGLQTHSGIPYMSIVYLVNENTLPKE